MKRNRILYALMAAACIAVMLGACGKKDKSAAEDSLLVYVPADTPYVIANTEPLPKDVVERMNPAVTEAIEAYRSVMREVITVAAEKDGDVEKKEMLERVSSVVDQLFELFTPEGMEAAGITRESAVAVYGNGLLPVIRIEVTSGDAFDAAVGRIEESAGATMKAATVDGSPYRYADIESVRLLLGVFEDHAVFTVVPTAFDDEQLKRAIGLTLPDENIAAAGTLQAIADDNDFLPHYLGFISLDRIASAFLDPPTGMNAELLALGGYDASDISDVCREEIRNLVRIAPRMIFGYESMSTDKIESRAIMELREDIAAELKLFPAAVPGLGKDLGGLMSFGFSLNPKAARDFYEARLDAIEADPFECEYFQDMQAGVAKGRAALQQPVPPLVYDFRGINVIVDDIDEFDLASKQPPTNAEATILLAMDNAPALLQMGQMFVPELAAMQIEANGKPVKVETAQLQGIVDNVFAAMSDDAISLSVGPNAESRSAELLSSSSDGLRPFFAMTLDVGRYYQMIGELMMLETGDEKVDMPESIREGLRDSLFAFGELYDRMILSVEFTDRGVEFYTKMALDD